MFSAYAKRGESCRHNRKKMPRTPETSEPLLFLYTNPTYLLLFTRRLFADFSVMGATKSTN